MIRYFSNISLFAPEDLLLLKEKNLGLRLTHKLNEAKNGGYGDAVPLSHLAGAEDIIRFIALAGAYEQSKDNSLLTEMEIIYNEYAEWNNVKTDCLPLLILSYAAKYKISDAAKRIEGINGVFIPESEQNILAKGKLFLKAPHSFILKKVIEEMPELSRLLAVNFNKKLIHRLELNYDRYACSDDMDYLFLTSQDPYLYRSGYDFNNYAMGKAGSRSFSSEDVVRQVCMLAGKYRTPEGKLSNIQSIFTSLKNYIHDNQQYTQGTGNFLEEFPSSSCFPTLSPTSSFLIKAIASATIGAAFIALACVLLPPVGLIALAPAIAYSLSSLSFAASAGAFAFFAYQFKSNPENDPGPDEPMRIKPLLLEN